jgi:hypothetical protein
MRHLIRLTISAGLMATADPRNPSTALPMCAPPDSATAPPWFWDSAVAFGGDAEFGNAESGVIHIPANSTEPADRREVARTQGSYSLVLITLTYAGPSAPDAYRLVLRRPTLTEMKRVAGENADRYGAGLLVGSITSISSSGPDTASSEPVVGMVWKSGLELALEGGFFAEDGPDRLQVVTRDSMGACGWWTPGSSIVPPPHGYFCRLRSR